MNVEDIENLKNDARTFLEENDLNLKQLYILLRINKDKEKKEIVKTFFNEFNSVKLSYSQRNNPLNRIETITPILEKLIAKSFLDFDTDYNIVKLTKENSNIIEKIIETDDDYFSFSHIIYEKYDDANIKLNTNKSLFAVLREIDRDNSTNVWRYKQNRSQFYSAVDYISNPINTFFSSLEEGKVDLPDKLVKECGTGLKSLSSKICKYLSEWMYKKDNYYINDKFIRHTLLFYLDYYQVDKTLNDGTIINSSNKVDQLSYEDIHYLLDQLNCSAKTTHNDGGLKKSELDHILWYCYKSFKV